MVNSSISIPLQLWSNNSFSFFLILSTFITPPFSSNSSTVIATTTRIVRLALRVAVTFSLSSNGPAAFSSPPKDCSYALLLLLFFFFFYLIGLNAPLLLPTINQIKLRFFFLFNFMGLIDRMHAISMSMYLCSCIMIK